MVGLILEAVAIDGATLLIAVVLLGVVVGLTLVVKRRRPRPPTPMPAEPTSAAADPERRSAIRRNVTPVIVKLRASEEIEGLVLDVSTGGLGLSLKLPVEAGEVMEVRPATAAPTVPWVRVEVRHCSTMAARWRVGCKFVDAPAAEVRNLFG